MTPGGRNASWAVLAAAIAFTVYVRTLAPGLIMIVDTPMFQFIGRALGIPHNPGYPLYVLVSHPFSYLPIGSLAYRINLLSALLGSVTVAMVYVIARRLGAGSTTSVAGALGLAFGRVFWSQAIIAEVYTLNAAIVAAMIAALLTWGETRRAAWFFTAAALFSAGLGNHTTIVGFAPGMVAYALMKDRRFALRVKTIAICGAMLAIGLSQYSLLLIRSKPGVYAESPARTIGDVLNIVGGRQFQSWLFAYDIKTVFSVRIPLLTRAILVPELTIPGAVLASAGAVYLLRRRLPDAALLLLGGAAIFAFSVNYLASDIHVFLIPAFVVMWPIAAVGAERLARSASARAPVVGTAIAAATLLLPASQLRANIAANDLSRSTEAKTYFDALFNQLPDRTLFVREDFIVDRTVSYKLVGEQAARGREIGLVGQRVDRLLGALGAGYRILAFPTGASRLRFEGLDLDYGAYPVVGPQLGALLDDAAPGSIVAVAVPAVHAGGFVERGATALRAIGADAKALAALGQSNLAVIGTVGARRGAIVRYGMHDIAVDVSQGAAIGETAGKAPGLIRVRAAATDAAVGLGGRDIVRSGEGASVAIWNPGGGLERVAVLQGADGFRPRLAAGALTLHALRGRSNNAPVLRTPGDVTAMAASGWMMLRIPPAGHVAFDVAGAGPLVPHVIDRSSRDVETTVTSTGCDTYVVAVRSRNQRDEGAVALAFGGIPARVSGRVVDGPPATVYAVDNEGVMLSPDDATELIRMARDEQAHLFGSGWSEVDFDGAGTFRWTSAREARVLLPVRAARPDRVRLQALRERAGPQTPTTVSVRLNGHDLPAQPLADGWHSYEWSVPAGMLRQGINEATLVLDRLPPGAGPARRGFAVFDIAVLHAP